MVPDTAADESSDPWYTNIVWIVGIFGTICIICCIFALLAYLGNATVCPFVAAKKKKKIEYEVGGDYMKTAVNEDVIWTNNVLHQNLVMGKLTSDDLYLKKQSDNDFMMYKSTTNGVGNV